LINLERVDHVDRSLRDTPSWSRESGTRALRQSGHIVMFIIHLTGISMFIIVFIVIIVIIIIIIIIIIMIIITSYYHHYYFY
jgi:hypothetical protein